MKPVTNNSNMDNLSEKEYNDLLGKGSKEGFACLEYYRQHRQQNQSQESTLENQLEKITKSYLKSFNYFLLKVKTKDTKCGEIAFQLTKDMYTALAKELL